MADYTKHLRLIKPSGNEYYDVENFNHNAELIDKETEKLNNAVTKIQEGATREKAGIVQYGTTEGKALEGMMLARMFGCVGYGGDIQDEGVKDVNYLYYDRNTRKMYKCINQNNDTSANVANFKPLDNNSLSELLEVKKLIHSEIKVSHEQQGEVYKSTNSAEIFKLKNTVYGTFEISLTKMITTITDYALIIKIKCPELRGITRGFGIGIIQTYKSNSYDGLTIPCMVAFTGDKFIQIYNTDTSGYTSNAGNDNVDGLSITFNMMYLD